MSVPEQSLVKLKSSADHIFDAGQMHVFQQVLIGQSLHVLSVALIYGMLIEASGGDDPLSRLAICCSRLLDVVQSGFPSHDYFEHQ